MLSGASLREAIDQEMAALRMECLVRFKGQNTVSIIWDGIRFGNPGHEHCVWFTAGLDQPPSEPRHPLNNVGAMQELRRSWD